MTLFDLLFLALFLAAAATLITALVAALRGRFRQALAILRRLGMAAAVYLAVVFAVSGTVSPRVFRPGEAKCNGEWCLAVAGVERPSGGRSLSVDLRLFSTARRVAMRENDVTVYLLDAHGRRIDPRPDPAEVPFRVQLGPGESVPARRVFDLPADAVHPALVVRFGGVADFPGSFVIGENGWFHKPDLLALE